MRVNRPYKLGLPLGMLKPSTNDAVNNAIMDAFERVALHKKDDDLEKLRYLIAPRSLDGCMTVHRSLRSQDTYEVTSFDCIDYLTQFEYEYANIDL